MAAIRSTGPAHVIEDEGTPRTQRSSMNFTGLGVSAADSGGKTVITIPGGTVLAATGREWYVDTAATSGGTGRSPSTAFITFAAAIAAAAAYDRVYILSDLPEALSVSVQGLHVIGVGRPVISSSGTSINDKIVNVIATEVTVENLRLFGHAGWKGTALCFNRPSGGGRAIRIEINGTAGSAATWYPTSPGTGSKTGIGGIGVLLHYSEGSTGPYFESLYTVNCSIGFAGGTWSTRPQVNNWFSSQCGQDLVIGLATGSNTAVAAAGPHGYGQAGTGNDAQSGSGTFTNLTFVSTLAGADLTTAPQVDLIGGGTTNFGGEMGGRNTFIHLDTHEGTGLGGWWRVGSIQNVFIDLTNAFGSTLIVEGQFNQFDNFYNLGSEMQLKSDSNTVKNQTGPGGIIINGSNNLVENISLSATGITGAGNNNSIKYMYGGQLNVTGQSWIYHHVLPSTLVSFGISPIFPRHNYSLAVTYGATITLPSFLGFGMFGTNFTTTATTAVATIANPALPNDSQEFTIDATSSVATHGAISVGNKFLLAGGGSVLFAAGAIANGKHGLVSFYYNKTLDRFIQKSAAVIVG